MSCGAGLVRAQSDFENGSSPALALKIRHLLCPTYLRSKRGIDKLALLRLVAALG